MILINSRDRIWVPLVKYHVCIYKGIEKAWKSTFQLIPFNPSSSHALSCDEPSLCPCLGQGHREPMTFSCQGEQHCCQAEHFSSHIWILTKDAIYLSSVSWFSICCPFLLMPTVFYSFYHWGLLGIICPNLNPSLKCKFSSMPFSLILWIPEQKLLHFAFWEEVNKWWKAPAEVNKACFL